MEAEGPSAELRRWFASSLRGLAGGEDLDPEALMSFLFTLADPSEVSLPLTYFPVQLYRCFGGLKFF